jgi:3-deoxy-D-manno-octulosonate 8-phosphate phosphatase (KDO 8-P phosphatase)
MDWNRLRLLILDVDGVLTDGRLWATTEGSSSGSPEFTVKAFHVQDGAAVKQWHVAGGETALISGRSSPAVKSRAAELGIRWCVTGVGDKLQSLDEILRSANATGDHAIVVGDDVPDVGLLKRAGFAVAVYNAVPAAKRAAMYVTRRRGGEGAVAEIVELVLRKQGRWRAPEA